MKTKSAVKKRFKLMGSGIIKMPQAGKRHCMRKRASRMIRDNRGSKPITKCEVRRMSRGLVAGANRVKSKSNKVMMEEYIANMSTASLIGSLDETSEVLDGKSE